MSDIAGKFAALRDQRAVEFSTALGSRLIGLALDDLAAVEADPNYRVDIEGSWHEPVLFMCSVCLAGSVIAKRFGKPRSEDLYPGNFDRATESGLEALDWFRQGKIEDAFVSLGLPTPHSFGLPDHVEICEYARDRATFRADMEYLATTLRAVGL